MTHPERLSLASMYQHRPGLGWPGRPAAPSRQQAGPARYAEPVPGYPDDASGYAEPAPGYLPGRPQPGPARQSAPVYQQAPAYQPGRPQPEPQPGQDGGWPQPEPGDPGGWPEPEATALGDAGQGSAPVLASRPRRLAGWLIDGIICGVIGSAAWIPAVRPHLHQITGLIRQYPGSGTSAANAVFRQVIMPSLGSFVLAATAAACLSVTYYWLLTGIFGTTIGKRIAGTRVIAENTGRKPRMGAAFFRAVVFVIGPVIFGIFFLADTIRLPWDRRRQCLHDKAARTLVVRRQAPAPGS